MITDRCEVKLKYLTGGNHTFIWLYNVEFNAVIILETLKKFESEHPDLKVTNWKTESFHVSGGPPNYFVVGIWVDHEPREEKLVPIRRMLNDDLLEVEEPISELDHALGQD